MRGSVGDVVEEVEGAYGGLGTGGVEARWRRSIFIPMSGESLKLIKCPPPCPLDHPRGILQRLRRTSPDNKLEDLLCPPS